MKIKTIRPAFSTTELRHKLMAYCGLVNSMSSFKKPWDSPSHVPAALGPLVLWCLFPTKVHSSDARNAILGDLQAYPIPPRVPVVNHYLGLCRLYLALINQARGLHGRILTEVVSTDRMQWGLYTWLRSRFSHTDRLSSVNKKFIIWQKQEQFNSFNVTGLY